VPPFTGLPSGLDKNTAPTISNDSSPLEFFQLFCNDFVMNLLKQETNRYCHQYNDSQGGDRRRVIPFSGTNSPHGTQSKRLSERLLVHR
jgi:hypothetical protein